MQRTMLKSKVNQIINLDHEVATLLGSDRPQSGPVDQPALAASTSKGAI